MTPPARERDAGAPRPRPSSRDCGRSLVSDSSGPPPKWLREALRNGIICDADSSSPIGGRGSRGLFHDDRGAADAHHEHAVVLAEDLVIEIDAHDGVGAVLGGR